MRESVKKGFSFGLTSATITTLGLMVGLEAGTNSKLVVIGGILTIAIADAFSDALGIHVSEEAENKHTQKDIWTSTFSTFVAKFFFALTFLVPVLFLDLATAMILSVVWGVMALTYLSYRIAKSQKIRPWGVIGEHVFIALLVVFIAHNVGHFISTFFGT
jgi:VIT1/CCC1 family predicted Fe2+/Mn2+ transporter